MESDEEMVISPREAGLFAFSNSIGHTDDRPSENQVSITSKFVAQSDLLPLAMTSRTLRGPPAFQRASLKTWCGLGTRLGTRLVQCHTA